MKIEADGNWCNGCETNCCDHFVLSNWPEAKIESLVMKYPFLKVFEHWINEEETEHTWIMECSRLLENGGCKDYPDGRPYFCDWAGVRYTPIAGCRLFEKMVKKNPERCE